MDHEPVGRRLMVSEWRGRGTGGVCSTFRDAAEWVGVALGRASRSKGQGWGGTRGEDEGGDGQGLDRVTEGRKRGGLSSLPSH